MSAEAHPRPPLVYATRRACEEARRLLPGKIIENEVSTRIGRGSIAIRRREGYALVFGRTFVATVHETRSPLTGRKAWTVTRVEPRS